VIVSLGAGRALVILMGFVVVAGVTTAAAAAVHDDQRYDEHDPHPVGGEELDQPRLLSFA
jgi:hypothetical protein